MLMGDENGVQRVGRQAPLREEGAQPPERNAAVDEYIRPARLGERAVPAGAAREYAYAHQETAARSGSSGSSTRVMSAPRARSLPTKFS